MNARVAGFRLIVVPPAATTLGETPGHSVPGESPVEAKNTTPDLTKRFVQTCFAGKFSATPTIRNFSATCSGYKIGGHCFGCQ